MAVVKLPLLSEEASGKFGENLVYKRSKGMNIVSRKPDTTGLVPSTRQLKVRSILSELATLQKSLSAAQAATWESMKTYRVSSHFGLPVTKSKMNSFMQVNFFRMDRDLSALLTAPTSSMKGNITGFKAVNKAGSPGTVTLTWTLPIDALSIDAVDIWVGGPIPTAAKKFQNGNFKHVDYIAGNLITTEISALETGKYYSFRARFVMEDGRIEQFLQTKPLQIA